MAVFSGVGQALSVQKLGTYASLAPHNLCPLVLSYNTLAYCNMCSMGGQQYT